MLTLNVGVDKLHRARPVERNACDDVLQFVRLQALHKFAHARAFQLEYADGVAAVNFGVNLRIVDARFVEVDVDAVVFLGVLTSEVDVC